jgi:MFS family permease
MPPIKTIVAPADKWLVLLSVCAAALVLPLDFSGVAAAAAAIARDYGGSSPVMLSWVINAFMLTFGSTLLTAGTLADDLGRKRVFIIGLTGFIIVSITLCVPQSLLTLDLLRAVQGIAAAATLAGGSAALAQEFEGPARTRVFSLLGTTFGVGLAFGPIIAGVLIETFGWRAIFLSGALIGVLALAFGAPRMRETVNPSAGRPDWPGALSLTATLALVTSAMLQATESRWSDTDVVLPLAAAFVALTTFIGIERRAVRPMLDLSLFRIPRFAGIQLLPLATACSYVVLLVLIPSGLMGVAGRHEIDAGLIVLSLSVPMLVVPFATATMTRWLSPGALSCTGLLIAAGGLAWLASVYSEANASLLVLPMVAIGVGTAMPWGLMDGLAISVVPIERAGMATGIFGTVRIAGEGLTLAITRAALAATIAARLPKGISFDDRIAGRLAAGDLREAMTTFQSGGAAEHAHALVQAYMFGFQDLLRLLALVVAASALVVFACLRQRTVSAEATIRSS